MVYLFCSCAPMAQEFDREQIHAVREGFIGVLGGIQEGGGGERVDEDEGRFAGVVGVGHVVGGGYASEMGDVDCLCCRGRHFGGRSRLDSGGMMVGRFAWRSKKEIWYT